MRDMQTSCLDLADRMVMGQEDLPTRLSGSYHGPSGSLSWVSVWPTDCSQFAPRIPSTVGVAQKRPIYFDPTEPGDVTAAFDVAITDGRDSERVQLGLQLVQYFSWEEKARGFWHCIAVSRSCRASAPTAR